VIRCPIFPGTMREVVISLLERSSGKRAGADFGVCFNPKFLHEGTAVHDYYDTPKTVIGEIDRRGGDTLRSLYANLQTPLLRTKLEVAEMVKYVDNTWQVLKVGFAVKIGEICKQLAIDSGEVMHIFCPDTKLNISSSFSCQSAGTRMRSSVQ
jgi:GDP-mannose 6-dehydrogenase